MGFTYEIFQTCCQCCSDSGALISPNGENVNADDMGGGDQYADVPKDTPDIPNVDFYAAAVSTVICSYKVRLHATRDYIRMAHEVARNPTASVRRGVQRGDAESMLELAMRYGSECEAEDRLDKAIELIELILARDRASTSGGPASMRVPELVLQRTHSAAALAFYSKYSSKRIASTSLGYHHDPDLLRAAFEADRAVAAGLRSRAALLVAKHLVGLAKQYDVRPGPRADKRFGGFGKLWEAYAAHRKLVSTIRDNPNLFGCAAEDCDVRVLEKRELKRCGGSCPPETKPSYCSRECQRRDWKSRHKAEGCVPVHDIDRDGGTSSIDE